MLEWKIAHFLEFPCLSCPLFFHDALHFGLSQMLSVINPFVTLFDELVNRVVVLLEQKHPDQLNKQAASSPEALNIMTVFYHRWCCVICSPWHCGILGHWASHGSSFPPKGIEGDEWGKFLHTKSKVRFHTMINQIPPEQNLLYLLVKTGSCVSKSCGE